MRIGVLGGPGGPADPELSRAARALGSDVGRRCWGLVAGLPGPLGAEVLDAAALAGVDVIEVLARGAEAAVPGSDRRRVAEPKARSAAVCALSDGIVVLPGGVDVLAVLFDVLTDHALGLAAKPCGVLDPRGVLDPLEDQLGLLARTGQLSTPLLRDTDPARLSDRLAAWRPAGQQTVREEVAWVRAEDGELSLVPNRRGLVLPGGERRPGEGGRVGLCRLLRSGWGVGTDPEEFELVTVLAVPGPDGVLRRVSCYRSMAPAPLPALPGAVRRPVGDAAACDPVAAELQVLLDRGTVLL